MASDKSKQVNAFLESAKAGLIESLALAQSLETKPDSSAILVGLSGGTDSTALLLLLNSLKEEFAFKLFACHVNHHVRLEEADKDEEFCRKLCSELSIPLTIEHLEKNSSKTVSEERLREQRYARLAKVALEKGIGLVAVAHIKDDQVETLLFRLFRGTGRPGLVGIPMARRLDDKVTLIRPLLNISRVDCETYLKNCGQSACHDSSNFNLAYRRNFIRHRVIPVIKEQFANFAESIERLRNLSEEEEAFISAAVESALSELSSTDLNQWRRAVFLKLAPAIQRRVIWQGLKFRDIEPSFDRIEDCRRAIAEATRVSLDQAWDLRATSETIFWQDKAQPETDLNPWQIELKVPGVTPILSLNYALKIEELKETLTSFPQSSELAAAVDLSKASPPLVVRTRMPGDTIQPFGMQEMVRLKKYLHNHKPASPTPFSNIVVADQNEILWVPGVGLSNKLKVMDKPSHLLTWLKLAADSAIC